METITPGRMCLLLLVILCNGFKQVCAERILVLPFNTYSHVKLMTLSSTQLLKAGHEVWMLSSIPPTLHNKTYGQINWIQAELPSVKELVANVSCTRETRECYKVFFIGVQERVFGHCKTILTNASLLQQLKAMDFRLVIYDGLQVYRCISMLPYLLNVTYVSLSNQHNAWLAGVPALPSIEPHQLTSFTSDMSFHQRLANMIIYIGSALFFPLYEKAEDKLLQELAPAGQYQNIHQVLQNTALWMTITQPTCLDYPRATAPNYIEINMPTTYYDQNRVSPELKAFADGAEQGLIIVTFGCLFSDGTLPGEIRDMFIQTFKEFPQRFILRYSRDDSFDKSILPKNILALEWVPMDELLIHPNTKLVVSHGGAIGMNEAVLHGVPLLVIPFLADQGYNAKRAIKHGWGISIDKPKLSKETLREGLKTLLYDNSYSESATFCKSILHATPSGDDAVAFWVNHIFQYGHRHLAPPRERPSTLSSTLLLDVNMTLIFTLLISIYMFAKFLLASAFLWSRAKKKYHKCLYYLVTFLTMFFVITMVHSVLTVEGLL